MSVVAVGPLPRKRALVPWVAAVRRRVVRQYPCGPPTRTGGRQLAVQLAVGAEVACAVDAVALAGVGVDANVPAATTLPTEPMMTRTCDSLLIAAMKIAHPRELVETGHVLAVANGHVVAEKGQRPSCRRHPQRQHHPNCR